MRILISTGVGLGIGLLFLVSVLGWLPWCPSGIFMVLHFPSMILAGALFHGEAGFWGSLPFAPAQWPILGALAGFVLQRRHKSANPAIQRTSSSPPVCTSGTSGPEPLS